MNEWIGAEEKIERLVSFAIGLTIGTLLWCSWQDMGLNERMQNCEYRLAELETKCSEK